jgi:HD-GYP domain-containing protein (c-di-GMP phosphodiesterase class II)
VTELEEKVMPVFTRLTSKRNIFQLFSDLKSLSDYRYKHSIGVIVLSVKLGKWLGLEERELSLLTMAACLYDIGYIKLPSYLLNKPDRFLPSEYEIMKQHTQLGYELLKESGAEHRVALVALQHHERENGSGYPYGLKGDLLDVLSKIIGIADVYTALTSERPHRAALAFYEAVQEIHQGMIQGRYNSWIGQIFLKGLMEAQVGSEVVLSDGTRGKILIINPNYPTRPMVAAGNQFIDLSKETHLQITEIIG